MNNQENQQEQTPSLSSLMKKRKHNELVVIEYELNEIVNKKIQKLQKKEKILLPVSDPHEEVKESDGLFVAGLSASVGSHMKNAALRHQPKFKLLDTDNQSIARFLGLNSIIDLSFDHPEAQTSYQDNRSCGPNWLSMYRKTKSLQNQFDIEENQDYDKDPKADKKTWTRGTWVAFRDGKTEIPPPPSKLTA
ncbi:hypothetical protein G6F46_007091 [Rhizopus delemar]|nr:hypothetical protein G6F54_001370 [Rhizopus delemar]KAG1514595.1 hypothetical protein G6F53_003550 [Rhizopus delemar]KAG1599274.1 hypothetical protein G6F47_005659 [Rhizopus delemar]KAG1614256.1 hypothetical protein G6F46_007091 [Rhizopus delemar]KAG1641613.1 hypothetical protein G6F44_005657 [Rhizopus delemar]